MPQPTRRERENKRKRQEILDAALSVFASGGFHGTTMAQISQASEYPLGTIYKFFSGKEQIYHDLVVAKGLEMGDVLMPIIQNRNLSPTQRLKDSMVANARFCVNNKEFIRIYISERSNIDGALLPTLNQKINRLHEALISLYSDLFQEGIGAGEFKDFPPREMAVIFTGILTATAWHWLTNLEEKPGELDIRIRTATELFIHGVGKS